MIVQPLTGEKMPVDEITLAMALDSLRGVDCQGCGRLKKQWLVFCNRCYRRLPQCRRDDLLRDRTNGFDEAFRAALRCLTTEDTEGTEIERF